MTLADFSNYVYRRTKTNSTSFLVADQAIAFNNANERVLSLIRSRSDNFFPTAWTGANVTTGTATPVFDANFHELIPLWTCYQYAVENGLPSANSFWNELQVKESELLYFYGSRNYRIFTVTIASPGVFTCKDHGLSVDDRVILSTTGTLPTGLSASTWYYVVASNSTDHTFQVSSTKGGTAINTTVSQSGTHYFATDTQQPMQVSYQSNR